MEIINLDTEDLTNKVNNIFECFNHIDIKINKMHKKVSEINKVYLKFHMNKTLTMKQSNSFLRFQMHLLENEKNYYKTISRVLNNKLNSEIFNIAESIIMILGSIENIEIEHSQEKSFIMKKIVVFRKHHNLDSTKTMQLINSTINNFTLIKDFIDLFKKYIEETNEKNVKENIHCNNFKINLENKKDHLVLEYNKYCHQIKELVNYFFECTKSIDEQLKHQEILKFLAD